MVRTAERANAGLWYHNLLWSQLSGLSGLTAPGYWWSQHLTKIDVIGIARPFAQFVATLDVNRGGYVDAAAISTNGAPCARIGQKREASGTAYLWVQHTQHTWRHAMGVETPVAITAQSGEIVIRMAPDTAYRVDSMEHRHGHDRGHRGSRQQRRRRSALAGHGPARRFRGDDLARPPRRPHVMSRHGVPV